MTDYAYGINEYYKKEKDVFDKLNIQELIRTMNCLKTTRDEGKYVYIAGNGGSGATASHFVGDFNKGLSLNHSRRYRFVCLDDNISTVLALANDVSFEDVFVEQLKNFLYPGDVFIAISGSGNSENIIRAAEYAKQKGNTIIGLTGYDGGRLLPLCTINLNVPINDMQIVEDVHMTFCHMMMALLGEENY